MSEKSLKFGDIVVNKKEFHASKQATALSLVDTDKIVVSHKFKCSGNGSKYFIGYLDDDDDDDDDDEDDIIRPLCIILPQMSGYIKYFDDGGKNMYFKIEDDNVYLRYIETWNNFKKASNIRFHSQPIYYDIFIKTEVKLFDGVFNTVFSDDKIQKERIYNICIAAIRIDSIMKINKKKLYSSLSRIM